MSQITERPAPVVEPGSWHEPTLRDVPDLVKLDLKCFDLNWNDETWSVATRECRVRINTFNFQPRAFWCATLQPSSNEDPPTVVLVKLGVDPKFRGLGLARAAMRDVRMYARSIHKHVKIVARVPESILRPVDGWGDVDCSGWLKQMGFKIAVDPRRSHPHSIYGIDFEHAYDFDYATQTPLFPVMSYRLYEGDCLNYLGSRQCAYNTIFMDVPDNIGLSYKGVDDRRAENDYLDFIREVVMQSVCSADVVWLSFNARYTVKFGWAIYAKNLNILPCVQTYTFGQHRPEGLTNNHRPLWRLSLSDAPSFYPERIQVPSWRAQNGDKRAKSPTKTAGDVLNFPRVTGNSKQRRPWHPTQLHEDLVRRCLRSCTRGGDSVLDPFGGTGTTLRVAKQEGMTCDLCELSPTYCDELRAEHPDLQPLNLETAA